MACLVSQASRACSHTHCIARHKRPVVGRHVNRTNAYCSSGRFHYFHPESAPSNEFRLPGGIHGTAVFFVNPALGIFKTRAATSQHCLVVLRQIRWRHSPVKLHERRTNPQMPWMAPTRPPPPPSPSPPHAQFYSVPAAYCTTNPIPFFGLMSVGNKLQPTG